MSSLLVALLVMFQGLEESGVFNKQIELPPVIVGAKTATIRLPVRNPRDYAVQIRHMKVSCTCTEPRVLSGLEIPAHGETELEVTLSLPMRESVVNGGVVIQGIQFGTNIVGEPRSDDRLELANLQFRVVVHDEFKINTGENNQLLKVRRGKPARFFFINRSVHKGGVSASCSLKGVKVQAVLDDTSGIEQQYACTIEGLDRHFADGEELRVPLEFFADIGDGVRLKIFEQQLNAISSTGFSTHPSTVAPTEGKWEFILNCNDGNSQEIAERMQLWLGEKQLIKGPDWSAEIKSKNWIAVRITQNEKFESVENELLIYVESVKVQNVFLREN